MTSIQNQQTSRNDDSAARAARRAGKTSQNSATPDAAATFSSMVAASQRKLQADRVAAKDAGIADRFSGRGSEFLLDDDLSKDEVFAPQVAPPLQDNAPQGQGLQATTAPVPMSHAEQIRTMSEESPDWLSLASLLPAGADDGVFEILMPNRAKVGVAVSDLPAGLSYLLTPEDEKLASMLRRHEMELEDHLKRRIRRNVKVVVL